MLVGVEYNPENKSIIASHYNTEGNLSYLRKNIPESQEFIWKYAREDEDISGKSWDDKPIKKVKSRFLNRYRLEELMLSNLSSGEKNQLFSSNRPKIYFLDIETEVNERNDFPHPDEANYPINLISVVIDRTVVVLSTLNNFASDKIEQMQNEVNEILISHGRKEQYKVKYLYYSTEKGLLSAFCKSLLPRMGFITGWNVTDFDWQTIANRCDKNDVNISQHLKSNRLMGQYKLPVHLGILDYDEVCRKFQPIDMPDNYTLDYMAHSILGIKKLQHPYKSFHEFQKDHYMFTMYNILDSVLVQLIDIDTDLMELAFTMIDFSKTEVSKVFTPVFNTEIFLCREFLNDGKIMPSIKKDVDKIKKKYKGAYVMPPIPGWYNLISCFDFESEYPNIQMQFNISPDTYLGKKDKIVYTKYKPEDLILTKNDTVFLGNKDSAARTILSRFFQKRVDIKGEGGLLHELKRQKKVLEDEKAALVAEMEK